MNKELTLMDEIEEIRQKAIEFPEYYTGAYSIRLLSVTVAAYLGYSMPLDWIEGLKKHPESQYSKRLSENRLNI